MRHLAKIIAATICLATAVAVAGAATEVDQVGQKFSKPTLTLKSGDMVHFLNRDDTTHNVNVIDANDIAMDQGLQKPGETINVLFDKAGRFNVRCAIHPRMKMTVTVE